MRASTSTSAKDAITGLRSIEIKNASTCGAKFLHEGEVVFVVNNDRSFLSHRATWAAALLAAGANVSLIAEDTGRSAEVESLGVHFYALSLGRESVSAPRAILNAASIFRFLVRKKPRAVFLSATTAYSLGWPAAVLLRNTRFVRIVGGVGRALSPPHSRTAKSRALQLAIRLSRRLPNMHTLFQTEADKEFFLRRRLATAERSFVIPGTGIDPQTWKPKDRNPSSTPDTVLFASRLYREKGIFEFMEAAHLLESSHLRFLVAGEPDVGVSTTVTRDLYAAWAELPNVRLLGRRDDMHSILQDVDLIVLPSTHPEGTPRIIMEAASCGVPAIVSNQPGCRAVVAHDVTGRVIDDLSPQNIAHEISRIMSNPEALSAMSSEARRKVVREFSQDFVLRRLLTDVLESKER